jgi:cleavage stimulation factor subunit 3
MSFRAKLTGISDLYTHTFRQQLISASRSQPFTMAEAAEQAFLAAQKTAMQDQGANGGAIEDSADTPDSDDSDDYDPSATMPQDFSVPIEILQERSASARPIATVPEDASAPHALLSPIQNRPSSTPAAQELSSKAHFPTSRASAQPQPRLKGGFVMEDEDEEVEEDEAKDGDVYDSADGMEAPNSAAAPHHQNSIDSTDSPHLPIQGAFQASKKASNVPDGAPDVVPSPTAVQNGDALPRDSTAIPAQYLPSIQVKIAQTHSNAATPTSALPKARLAHDTIGILEDRIKEDPRGDIDAWLSLLGELRSRNKKDEVRRVYDRFFKEFPLAVRPRSF